MKNDTQNYLLMTATITPKSGVPNLKRTDPKVRLEDYKKSLKFYLNKINTCFDGIIFSENSNSDVSELKDLAEAHGLLEKVEFISFDGLDYPPYFDRGYGEFKLLDYAMEHSNLIKNKVERIVVWKVTGRYIITNIEKTIRDQPSEFDIYCNCRNYPFRWVDTYVMAWTPKAYDTCIKGIYEKLKLNVPGIPSKAAAEEILRGHLDLWIRESTLVQRFKLTPQIEGARGADNKGYSTDNFWKFFVRKILSIFLPWVWI